MQTRYSDEKAVHLSVCLSNAWIVIKPRKICPEFYTKDHLAYFSEKKNGWLGVTYSTWNFGSTGHRLSKIADFEPIFAPSASAVTPSEKSSINTNRKSTTCCLPISLRWSSYVVPQPPKGGSKMHNGRFSSKIALCLTKVCYKVSLCENCQWQSCKAFIYMRWTMFVCIDTGIGDECRTSRC